MFFGTQVLKTHSVKYMTCLLNIDVCKSSACFRFVFKLGTVSLGATTRFYKNTGFKLVHMKVNPTIFFTQTQLNYTVSSLKRVSRIYFKFYYAGKLWYILPMMIHLFAVVAFRFRNFVVLTVKIINSIIWEKEEMWDSVNSSKSMFGLSVLN